jgi:hypothetical protein
MHSRRMIFVPVALGIILAAAATTRAATTRAGAAGTFDAALESIQSGDVRKHIELLASDTLEGRESGSRGGKAAGTYIVEQLKKLGIAGGGDKGGFFQDFGDDYRNILAKFPGVDPDLAAEVVLVGAHYDHVGYGSRRNSLGPIGYIHNGADDNASGTAGLMEIAEAFAMLEPAPRRTVLCVFWDAEERGLLGSDHWIREPTVPLKQVRLMINADMIGRLRNNHLEVYGTRTGSGFRSLVSRQNRGLDVYLDFTWDTEHNSDHYPFYVQNIPYLMFHTLKHDDYHRPSDDIDKINFTGSQEVARLMFRTALAAANSDSLPRFRRAAFDESNYDRERSAGDTQPAKSRLGVVFDPELAKTRTIKLTRVAVDSPAERGGLKIGDRILQFAGYDLAAIEDFRTVVLAAANPVRAVVEREGNAEPLELTIELDGSPQRVGLLWRTDEAEPGSVIITSVAPGSPAAHAGLARNDRIDSIDGKTFGSESEFRRLITAQVNPLPLTYERNGRMVDAKLEFLSPLQ